MEGIIFLRDVDKRAAVNLMTTKYLVHEDVTFLPKGRSGRYGDKSRTNHAEEYNYKMNGTDVADQLRTNLNRNFAHRRRRWILPIIQWYIDQARVNAWLVHKEIVEAHKKHHQTSPSEKRKTKTKSQRDFVHEVVHEVCEYLADLGNFQVETRPQTRNQRNVDEEDESPNHAVSPSTIPSNKRKQ